MTYLTPLLVLGSLWAPAAYAGDDGLAPEDLPARAQALRDEGLDADQVREALTAAREAGLKPNEAADLLHASVAPVEEHGPIEGFGAFVKTRLDEGLRGSELVAAIGSEHAKRGLGKGKPAPSANPKPRPTSKPTPRPTSKPTPKPTTTKPSPTSKPMPTTVRSPSGGKKPGSRFNPKGRK